MNFGSRIALILQCWNFISAERQSHHIPHLLCPWGPLSPLCFYCDYLRCVLSLGPCMEYLSFCDQFLSLGITSSRPLMRSHMPGFPSILRLSDSPLYVCNIPHMISFYRFIHWWIIGFFDNWAVVNKAATNPAVQRSLWDPVFTSFGYVSKTGTAGSRGSSSFNFWGTQPQISCSGCTNSHSHQQYTSVAPFSPSPGQSLLSLLFDNSHSNEHMVISFDLHFPDD